MPRTLTKAPKKKPLALAGDFSEDFSITYTSLAVKRHVLSVAYRDLKEKILGKTYSLSLVFTDSKTMQKINVQYRKKDYVPNVLSFPLSKENGEIYICHAVAKKEAAAYGHTAEEHLRYLYIHGCLHLWGLQHGKRMDALEKRYMEL